ncbi:MAG: ExeM/NucH family extracellular endonuclease [Renibacterium salmoninarum]|nr:ExeM/NucH family extracellular endonuclease [Renibacterium salmoninarum]
MTVKSMRAALGTLLAAGLIAAPIAASPALAANENPTPAESAVSASPVVINEAYLNGGSSGASYKNKFVELYNASDAAVSLDGWSLQYRSATGSAAPNGVAPLKGSIAARGYYLVKGNSNAANGAELPAADADASNFSFSGSAGTLILAKKSSALNPLATGSVTGNPDVADLLGYGSSNTFETAAASAPSVSKSLNRTGFADSDDNSKDFSLAAPTPQGSGGTGPVDPGPGNPTISTIKEIQGESDSSPLVGKNVTTRGLVTAAYPTGGFNGYFIQTPGTGGDIDFSTHKASDAVFVYSPDTVGQVRIGDYVEVTGTVSEFPATGPSLTEITVPAGKLAKLTDAAPAVKAAAVGLPESDAQRESLEGMLLAPTGDFTVADNYSLNSYGEVGLAAGTAPLTQPNSVYPYGSAENTQLAADNAAKSIGLDDGASTNFLSKANQGLPLPYLTKTDPVRVGSAVSFKTNVIMDQRNGSYKFQPLSQLTPYNAATVQPAGFANTRTTAPNQVGGNLKISSFNVENYFIHTGDQDPKCVAYTDRDGNPITVQKGCNQRGAWDQANLQRQQDKIVAGITGTGADIVSLEEIENSAKFADTANDRDKALRTLVEALNASAGSAVWDYVRSPQARPDASKEDVIRTAFIFKQAAAEPVGDSVILDDAAFTGIARQPLAQSFKAKGAADSSQFLAIVNHFKSKGSAATPDDTDKGQGNSNLARVKQAQALLGFADQLKTDKNTDKVLLIGDFNSYSKEDPLNKLTDAGYLDLESGSGKQTYLFGGRIGSLDHVFASPSMKAQVTGADVWNINSVESVALDYSRWNYNVTNYYNADPYRASDHDPVVVGLNVPGAPAPDKELNFLNINDFHGRIDQNTVKFAGTVEQLKAASPAGATAFLSAGDNVSASLYASSVQGDQPTIDVLNALGLQASAVGNHEFDKGYNDLVNRIQQKDGTPNAAWSYLGANVYKKGTTTPALPEYKLLTVNGEKVAVIGAVTQETGTLVSPEGVKDLDFGDPVEAVNRVAAKLQADKAADFIVADFHEGAGSGAKDGATIEQEIAAGGAFADIVTKTSAAVNVIFTGHTHKEYAWDAPIPGKPGKTRPVLQTGNYGENVGQVQLMVNPNDKSVTSYTVKNNPRSTAADADLVAKYPAVAKVKDITDKALAYAKAEGSKPLGSIKADITTAYTTDPKTGAKVRDDRSNESTLGNLVADSLKATLAPANLGGAEIGIVNPGGLRADLLFKNANADDGVVNVANANAVLPFVNNLWTTTLTGAQFKTLLEQQWQPDGSSRTFLALGVSKNVSFTYDPTRAKGDRITSIVVNGGLIDPAKDYRIGTFSFLATGGDNFSVFKEGKGTKDSGLVDRDGWFDYITKNSPLSPDFNRRGVLITGAPASVTAGQQVTVKLSKADLTSLGTPASSSVKVRYEPESGAASDLGTAKVTAGEAEISFKVPAALKGGKFTLTTDTGTNSRLPISVPTTSEPPGNIVDWVIKTVVGIVKVVVPVVVSILKGLFWWIR